MREIKFRVWNTISNEWILFEKDIPVKALGPLDILDIRCSYGVLMQYTGLKDKNGKEIYEGDILLVPDDYTDVTLDDGTGPAYPENHLSEVIFKDYAFGVDVKENADYISKGFCSFLILDGDIGLDDLEIIGNIHEHPHLLDKGE